MRKNIECGTSSKEQQELIVREAIIRNDRKEIEDAFVETGLGVNDRHDYGCNPLMYAVDKSRDSAVADLLSLGARIEDTEREYTPLFTSAEKGDISVSEVLMGYGASLAGGFSFNKETPLSISGFNFCDALVAQLTHRQIEALLSLDPFDVKRFQNMCYKNHQTESEGGNEYAKASLKPYYLNYQRSKDEWFSCYIKVDDERYIFFKPTEELLAETFPWMSMKPIFINKIIQFCNDMDDLWSNQGEPWASFAEVPKYLDSVLIDAMTIYNNLKKHLGEYFDNDKLENLYQLAHKFMEVKNIAKGKHKYASNKEKFAKPYSIKPPVCKEKLRKKLNREELESIIGALNTELKHKTESGIDWNEYPKLFIADYRCIHYYGKHFNEAQLEHHSSTHQLNRIMPALAVFSMENKSPSEHVLMTEGSVNESRQIIMKLFDEFSEAKKENPLHERMANNYVGHQGFVEKDQSLEAQVLREKKILNYPYYAASVMPDHPLRYGLGLKPIKSLSHTRRQPNYDRHGKPENARLGKTYITLFTPEEIDKHRKRSAIGKHNREVIILRGAVAPEREVDAPGGVLPVVLFHEEVLTVPDFSKPYQPSYQNEFGLSSENFDDYKTKCRNSNVDNQLLHAIKDHKMMQYVRLAQREAKRRGGYLIYWNAPGNYSLEPEPVRPHQKRFNAEERLLRTVGPERFESVGSLGNTQGIRTFFSSQTRDNAFGDCERQEKRPKLESKF